MDKVSEGKRRQFTRQVVACQRGVDVRVCFLLKENELSYEHIELVLGKKFQLYCTVQAPNKVARILLYYPDS